MNKIEDILALCIKDIKSGRSTLADCLDRYPSLRQDLEPLLKIALSITEPPPIKPANSFRVQAKVQLMEHIHAERSRRKSWRSFSVAGINKQIWNVDWLKTVTLIVAIVVAVSALGTVTAYASQDSLPGEILYPVKIGTEQIRRALTTDDISKVELELTFAGIRLQEIEALAIKAPNNVMMAVNGYETNIEMAIKKAEQARDSSSSTRVLEMVSLGISQHLSMLDSIEEGIPEAVKEASKRAKEISIRDYVKALRLLAQRDPTRATEMNIDTMRGRLNRASTKADKGDSIEVGEALRQFEELRKFGEEIVEISEMWGYGTSGVDELNARATSAQLEVLGSIYMKVSEDTKRGIEEAITVLIDGHRQAVKRLQEKGVPTELYEELPLPNEILEKLKENISKQEHSEPGSGEEPGNGEEPGSGEEPSNGEEPGNGEGPGSGEEPDSGEEPGNGEGPGSGEEPDSGGEPGSGKGPVN